VDSEEQLLKLSTVLLYRVRWIASPLRLDLLLEQWLARQFVLI